MALTAVQAFAEVLSGIRQAESNAIDTGKPTMWAYFADMADALERTNGHWHGSDGGNPNRKIIREMRDVLNSPDLYVYTCQGHERIGRSQEASIMVYATRVLHLAGERVPVRSLDWLRAQKRWSATG